MQLAIARPLRCRVARMDRIDRQSFHMLTRASSTLACMIESCCAALAGRSYCPTFSAIDGGSSVAIVERERVPGQAEKEMGCGRCGPYCL